MVCLHLKDTLDRRNSVKKIKQKQQLKAKKKARKRRLSALSVAEMRSSLDCKGLLLYQARQILP